MRPLELRLRNFRSFHGGNHTFDFRDRRLIGVVGPIGSGKSTILDAVTFALYGRTPRTGAATRSLIHQREDQGAVSLRFEVEGEVWEAVRQIRRVGSSQHALYRLPADEPDIEPVEKVLMEREVSSRTVDLLGLDYEGFGRSVMLAQGQFAQFLSARPAERDRVLKGVFGYERISEIRELAREAVRILEVEIYKLDSDIKRAEAVKADLRERREELAESVRRFDLLEAIRPEFEELTERIGLAEERRRDLETELVELSRRAGQIPEQEAAEVTLSSAEQAQTRLVEAWDQVRTAKGMLKEAEAITEADGFRERERRCEQAGGLVVRLGADREAASRAADRLNTAVALVEDAEKAGHEAWVAHATARTDLDKAEKAAREAAIERDAAARRLQDARHADIAGTLRHELEPGDNCPVCDQPVHRIPDLPPGDTAAVEREAAEARRTKAAADGRLKAATGNAEGAEVRQASAEERLAEARSQAGEARRLSDERAEVVTRLMAELECLVGEGGSEVQLAEERRALEAYRDAASEARRQVDQALDSHAEARTARDGAVREIRDLRVSLAGLATFLQAGDLVPDDEPGTVRSALAFIRSEWDRRTTALGRRAGEAKGEAEEASAKLAELRAAHRIQGSLEAALADVKARGEQIHAEIERGQELVSGAAELLRERRSRTADADLNRRLVRDLTDSRFIRFLLNEERATLAGLGSEHFQRLSSGRYRFTDDGKFGVVDLNYAEADRRAGSLSGGETFLASLSLALGLAEMVGRRGGRLDAFFLDEGFGTLDPEHLDLAMEGIESLVTDREQRLVVVVSHVPELKERLEDLIRLDKDPLTGDSIVVSGGTP